MPETVNQDRTHYVIKKEISTQRDFTRPDALLDLGWFGHINEHGKDQSTLTDAIGALLGEEYSNGYQQIGAVTVAYIKKGCDFDIAHERTLLDYYKLFGDY